MFKTANVGTADRIVRLLVGIILIAAPWLFQSPIWQNPAMLWGIPVIGIILAATGLVRFCPLYRLLGIRTCKAD
ncbi:YgaP family membrane protein [Hoeflea prorocentri]|uniref:DUF2892 domain-containing protein n=1 Tax=Hoeflea prorocentri TaxID=1922333 RepID=A0A9X3UIV4_9HYPH|nr:DUF2892 domain-containing protein [Hoeflea prorocentri]MCY6381474.1 DUF2892 domain-containing protein [Hoeflea prorocentri]MDA5399274.1 DUF2892 domain-containing protein [Hoeflea prorocentri]